jgi:hypothetical protein
MPGYGYCQKFRIRPDSDPDRQHCFKYPLPYLPTGSYSASVLSLLLYFIFLSILPVFFLQEAAVHIPLSQDLYETVRDMVSSAAAVMSRPLVPPPQQPSGAVLRNPLGPQPGFQPPAGLPGPQNRHSLPPSLFPGKEAAGNLANKK